MSNIIINSLIKKIIKDNPRVLGFTNKDDICKQVVKQLYPDSYKKLDSKTWEQIITDLSMANYEIEKICRR